jgi:carboxyl-terminal processing protease
MPIYKTMGMHTVCGMRKRILPMAAGAILGIGLSPFAVHFALIWGLFPNRDLGHATSYIQEVMEIVGNNYVDPPAASYDKLARSAIHGMVETLDPHSEYLESKDNEELEDDLSGEFGGIGVQVEVRDGHVYVIAPMAGTPGERAGILGGDEILSIDGKAVDGGSPMNDVVDRLRGAPRTVVDVALYRPATRQRMNLRLVREIIKTDSIADARVLPGGVGYIELTDFSEHTGQQFDDALDGLLKKNISGLILDLRDNPGGLIDSAVDVAEPFFRKGELIVYTQGRRPEDREDYRAQADGDPVDLPVAVLINAETASAAEIVTGALKDTGRAVIVGERSFGKGSVQSIFKLKNGEGLRLTTAHYFTPSGVSIHEKGIAPQVEVVMSLAEDEKLRNQRARTDLADPREFRKRFGFDPIPDRQLQAALDVLRGVCLIDSQAAGLR